MNLYYLIFRGTFVHHANHYWTDVYSDILSDGSGDTIPTCGASCMKSGLYTIVLLLTHFAFRLIV